MLITAVPINPDEISALFFANLLLIGEETLKG